MPAAGSKQRPRSKARDNGAVEKLLPHNCHFSANTLDVIERHSALTKSGGVSGYVRTVIEVALADSIDFSDPRYRDLAPVARPKERYPGQFKRLGLE